jgi:hypothetical protein
MKRKRKARKKRERTTIVNYAKLYLRAKQETLKIGVTLDEARVESTKLREHIATLSEQILDKLKQNEDLSEKLRWRDSRYDNLKGELISCLRSNQVDAAQVARCSEERYALELLKLYQSGRYAASDNPFNLPGRN